MNIKAAAILPGLPHLLRPQLNADYNKLARGCAEVGNYFAQLGIKRVVYYSTQWISVLGHLYQAKADLQGLHVDDNWHDLTDLSFHFRVDRGFAEQMAAKADALGYQTKQVDYEGFPVDTGTIVADHLLNQGRFHVNMVSCCVYSDYADTAKFAASVAAAAGEDDIPTAVVAVSMLSGRYFTTKIDLREDHVSEQADDQWNRRFLGLLEGGKFAEAESLIPTYAAACKADMGMKALAFIKGSFGLQEGHSATARAYGGLYGTGAAVVQF